MDKGKTSISKAVVDYEFREGAGNRKGAYVEVTCFHDSICLALRRNHFNVKKNNTYTNSFHDGIKGGKIERINVMPNLMTGIFTIK